MSARYTRQEFHDAGIEPQECDRGPYNASPTAPETDESYWFSCDYHEGYIDGYEAGARENR